MDPDGSGWIWTDTDGSGWIRMNLDGSGSMHLLDKLTYVKTDAKPLTEAYKKLKCS